MSKLSQAIIEIESIDELARRDRWLNRIHPLVKLAVTVLFLVVTVSFGRYDLPGTASMVLYPFFLFEMTGLSVKRAFYRLRIILPIVCIVGVFNPIFDREIVTAIGGLAVSGGVISMITLMLKGVFTVLASYLLIATTTIDDICYAMRLVHIPKIIVTEIMLIYRYIFVLVREGARITQAYSLRAPGQKGIRIGAWGPLVGQLLLRSMDRAELVYESMNMRGFSGEFPAGKKYGFGARDSVYLIVCAAGILILRLVPLAELIGGLALR